jgi:predicted metal-dependent peptidase
MQNLGEVNRERYDYTAFLKKFAVMGEAMKINDDEFDYVFYTYGLKLYKKMPLIEPLEYKDVKRIREFAIIIDTSGSVSGELVQTFVNKTYNILKTTESFFSKINLYIIQCDAKVQEAVKITSQDEFDKYLCNMKLKGFGGTDFRPAFSYVDELVKTGEFTRLKGVIYFTDGWGTFPLYKPDYETAFVFLDNDYHNPEVPPWAIKLVLQDDEI